MIKDKELQICYYRSDVPFVSFIESLPGKHERVGCCVLSTVTICYATVVYSGIYVFNTLTPLSYFILNVLLIRIYPGRAHKSHYNAPIINLKTQPFLLTLLQEYNMLDAYLR